MKPLDDISSRLQTVLAGRVKFALLYGSILTPYFNADSDLDLGVFFGRPVSSGDKLGLQHLLEEALAQQYEFDLVVLDTADPIIAMQILANGRLIVEEDRLAFIRYKARMISQYLDFKMDRKRLEDRILEGSIYA
ncbi:MAG: hypothetical protein DKINENOH_01528 [bacterium]|nr:hypothetical protein [bacterium]